MSNPFILIARIRVKEGKIEEYFKIAKEADNAVNASEPDMLIHTFDQDPTDPLEFTWSEVYRNSEAMVHHLNNPPVQDYVKKHTEIADCREGLALTLEGQEKHAEALEQINLALTARVERLGEMHTDVGASYACIASRSAASTAA